MREVSERTLGLSLQLKTYCRWPQGPEQRREAASRTEFAESAHNRNVSFPPIADIHSSLTIWAISGSVWVSIGLYGGNRGLGTSPASNAS